jgi:hypothetical protein
MINTDVSSPMDGVPPDIVAVISATVATAIARRVRIKRIRYLKAPAEQVPLWAFQGRVTIMTTRFSKR